MPPHKEKEWLFLNALVDDMPPGLNPWCCFTQAWHETAGFRKVIGKHNYWGIKKPRSWTGQTVSVWTSEYISGKKVRVKAAFIDFTTCAKALEWWAGLLGRLYPEAWENRDNPVLFFNGLVSGRYKWATDPSYPAKLVSVYENLRKSEIAKHEVFKQWEKKSESNQSAAST